MTMRRELNAEAAEAAYRESLADFQRVCPIIEKRKVIPTKSRRRQMYRYAPLDHIVPQVRKLLADHGFSPTILIPNTPLAKASLSSAQRATGPDTQSRHGFTCLP